MNGGIGLTSMSLLFFDILVVLICFYFYVVAELKKLASGGFATSFCTVKLRLIFVLVGGFFSFTLLMLFRMNLFTGKIDSIAFLALILSVS